MQCSIARDHYPSIILFPCKNMYTENKHYHDCYILRIFLFFKRNMHKIFISLLFYIKLFLYQTTWIIYSISFMRINELQYGRRVIINVN